MGKMDNEREREIKKKNRKKEEEREFMSPYVFLKNYIHKCTYRTVYEAKESI